MFVIQTCLHFPDRRARLPKTFSEMGFWRLKVQHHQINFIGVATLQLDVAEQSKSAVLKPEECMGDVFFLFGCHLGHLDNGNKGCFPLKLSSVLFGPDFTFGI